MTAIGRAAVIDPYLLRGLLSCLPCGRLLIPTYADGGRAYDCGPICPQPSVPAETAETDLLLAALIRAAVTRHPDLGRSLHGEPGDADAWLDGPAVTPEELNRWQRCDVTDRRAVLLLAYTQVLVNAQGKLRPVWRRHADQLAGAGA